MSNASRTDSPTSLKGSLLGLDTDSDHDTPPPLTRQGSTISVVDPQRRKLRVPVSAIKPTRGVNGRSSAPSLCLLYQAGRCRQGLRCYQLHAARDVVDRLRAEAEGINCCCQQHGDPYQPHLLRLLSSMVGGDEGRVQETLGWLRKNKYVSIMSGVAVPFDRLGYTTTVERIVRQEGTLVVLPPSVVCSLHGRPEGCRFGADCKFLHICREALHNELRGMVPVSAGPTVTTLQSNSHNTNNNNNNNNNNTVQPCPTGVVPLVGSNQSPGHYPVSPIEQPPPLVFSTMFERPPFGSLCSVSSTNSDRPAQFVAMNQSNYSENHPNPQGTGGLHFQGGPASTSSYIAPFYPSGPPPGGYAVSLGPAGVPAFYSFNPMNTPYYSTTGRNPSALPIVQQNRPSGVVYNQPFYVARPTSPPAVYKPADPSQAQQSPQPNLDHNTSNSNNSNSGNSRYLLQQLNPDGTYSYLPVNLVVNNNNNNSNNTTTIHNNTNLPQSGM
ncbi:hypothetical protein ADEAN_000587600 [Angomonas deanei]|uniref:C3H1-type domain-containing protein n=1 Tax=Angomonas deanei TaxID=59799 RepID=A0A7G2CEQ6_9TRYP|nr:hypothetical protein ADEAN_000587600 [Angomonas deanei]